MTISVSYAHISRTNFWNTYFLLKMHSEKFTELAFFFFFYKCFFTKVNSYSPGTLSDLSPTSARTSTNWKGSKDPYLSANSSIPNEAILGIVKTTYIKFKSPLEYKNNISKRKYKIKTFPSTWEWSTLQKGGWRFVILTHRHVEQSAEDVMKETISGKSLCRGRQLVPAKK